VTLSSSASSESIDAFDLTGRRALVTGASRGIGREIALGFAARGADVLAVARSTDALEETAALAADSPGRIQPQTADLRDADSIDASVAAAVEAFGGLDILVNNAADDHESSIEKTDLSTWTRVLELNLQSCFLLSRAAAPHLREDGGGKVINVASILGLVAVRNDSAYIAAKHGLIGLTKALALEWGRRNVQVNALAPGFVETAMMAEGLAIEAVADHIRKNTPQGRWAQPEEIVGPAVFLASNASNFMTGQVLVVDGGWTAQ
jgi:NAD(P)-dependent dehydrogenase (short-subunit alcohol dehydrogenase family)